MKIFPIIFILIEIVSIIYYKRLYFFLATISSLVDARKTEKMRIVLIDKFTLLIAAYFLGHIVFMLYCVFLIFSPTWQPGCMLLLLSSLESYGVKAQIPGAFQRAEQGFVYPSILLKYTVSVLSIYVLLNLM